MKNNSSKKVVIIHDIDSASIEKAILILRNSGRESLTASPWKIVDEAKTIINAYRKTIHELPDAPKKSAAKGKPLLFAGGALLLFAAALCFFMLSPL